MTDKSKKPTKPRLSRDKVIGTAMAMADSDGIETLSMRGLARALKVEAMSLYHHVANKEAMIDAMVEQVATEFYHPKPETNWRAEIEKRCVSAYETLIRHPWAAQATMSRVNDGPVWLSYVDATLGCLVSAGFTYHRADRAWNALDSHIYGFALQELRFPFHESEYQAAAQEYLPMIPRDSLPHLYEMAALVAAGKHFGKHDFTYGLNLILDGLEQSLKEGE